MLRHPRWQSRRARYRAVRKWRFIQLNIWQRGAGGGLVRVRMPDGTTALEHAVPAPIGEPGRYAKHATCSCRCCRRPKYRETRGAGRAGVRASLGVTARAARLRLGPLRQATAAGANGALVGNKIPMGAYLLW